MYKYWIKQKCTLFNVLVLLLAMAVFLILDNKIIINSISYIGYYSLLIILVLFVAWFEIPSYRGSKQRKPCVYNTFGYVELHVNDKFKRNRIKFFKYCAKAILNEKANGLDVCFVTWLKSKEEIIEILNREAVLFFRPSLLEMSLIFFVKLRYGIKTDNDTIKVFVLTDKLSEKSLEYLSKMANLHEK